MTDCIFCKIATSALQPETIFYQDDQIIVILDDDWAVKGHTLVIWKEHVTNMSDLSEGDFKHFSSMCRKVEGKLLDVLNVDKSIVLKSGGLEPHFHFHIYPVSSDISWNDIKNIFDKKTKYIPKEGETEELLGSLSIE